MAKRRGSVAAGVAKADTAMKTQLNINADYDTVGVSLERQKEMNDALLLLGAAMDIFEKGRDTRGEGSPTTTAASSFLEQQDRVMSTSTADLKPMKARKGKQVPSAGASNPGGGGGGSVTVAGLIRTSKRDNIHKLIGKLTTKQRRAKVDKWLKKRALMIARQKENSKKKKTMGRYVGRTKFAMSRRRVKGRFVSLAFLNERGIKFDSGAKPQGGWVCSTLGGKVFVELQDALEAVDAHANNVNKKDQIPKALVTAKTPEAPKVPELPNKVGAAP